MMGKGEVRMSKKQKAAAAAAAVVAAAGMVTGSVIDSPAELMKAPTPAYDLQLTEEEDTAVQEERQKRPADRFRAWILGLPAAVRMLVGIPLWTIGWVLLTALSTLWMGVAAPVVSRLLGWLCLAVVLLAVFAASVKAAFPALRLKEIFRPGNLAFLLGMTALLAAADMALPTVWEGYGPAVQVVWRIGATCLLAAACSMELRWQGRRATARKASSRTEIEEAARTLADTVCPPRF